MQVLPEFFTYNTVKPETYKLKFYPRISVIVPSYNQGDFLERTLLSVINQNYPNLELIVIDGGSTDRSVDILKKYSSYFAYTVSEQDTGQANAINKGFRKATGDLMGWMNSDDCYVPGSFYHLAKAYAAHPRANFFYGDALTIDSDDRILGYWNANLVADRYLRFGGLVASHTAFWKKEIHQYMDENLYCNVDGELWIRMVKNSVKRHVRFPIGAYRLHQDSKSSSGNWADRWKKDDLYIENKHGPPPKRGSYLNYEYNYIQRFYHFIHKLWPRLKSPY